MDIKKEINGKFSWGEIGSLILFAVFALTILYFTFMFYFEERRKTISNVEKQLENIHALKKELIANWIKERTTDLKVFSSGSIRDLLSAIKTEKVGTKEILLAAIEKRLDGIKRDKNYKKCYILNENLNKIVAGEGGICHFIEQNREAIKGKDGSLISSPHLENGLYIIEGLIPIKGKDEKIIGYFVFAIDAEDYLYKIIKWLPVEGRGAETILAKREAENVIFLNPVDVEGEKSSFLSFSVEKENLPVVKAALGKEGFYEGIDYKGKEVFSFIGKIPDSDWLLIVKIEKEIALKGLEYSRNMAILFGLLALCVTGLLIFNILLFFKQKLRSKLSQTAYKVREAEKVGRVGFWELDHKTKKIVWSTGVYEIFGVKEEKFNPTLESTLDLVHPEDRENVEKVFLHSVLQKTDHEVVHRLKNRDIIVMERCKHFYDENGKAVKSIGTVRDITKEYVARKKLEESEEKFRILSDFSLTGVYLMVGGTLEYVNKSYADFFDYSPQEIINKMKFLDFVADEEKERVAETIKKIETGEINEIRFEFKGLTKNGKTRDIVVYQRAILFEGKRAFIGILLDVTEKKQLEEKFLQSQKMESIGRFAGGIAHDFNNMLQIVISNSEEILLNKNIPPKERENVEEILSASMRSANLCRQLLSFSRRTPARPKSVELNSHLENSIKMIRRLIGENISLETNFFKEKLFVFIDPTHLDQIIFNLASNSKDAIKEKGRIRITTSKAESPREFISLDESFEEPKIEYALIAFEDNGSGMDKDSLEKVFEPFFTTKGKTEGTGLGLATVYGIVKQNGGFIHPYSEIGKGTVFKIYLPIKEGLVEEENSEKETSVEQMKIEETSILVCEDEPQLLNIIKIALERAGYKVTVSGDPILALKTIDDQKERITLLLTDMVMPHLSGIELFRKAKKVVPSLKCILMSGYSQEISVNPDEILQGVTYIEKPFRTSRLLEIINETLKK